MTLYRRLIKTSRPYLLASMTGSAVWSTAVPALAQQFLEGTPAPGVAAPGLLPIISPNAALPQVHQRVGGQPLMPPAPLPMGATQAIQVQTVPVQTAQMQTRTAPAVPVHPVQLQQTQYQAGGQSAGSQEPRLLERVGRVFRGTSRTAVPVDPGMDYPKAPKIVPPPQAPGIDYAAAQNNSLPPLVPEATRTAAMPSSQPALFHPPVQANPLNELVPPAPTGGPALAALTPPEPASGLPPLKNAAELKAIMQSPSPLAQAPAATTTSQSTLPKLDFNAPMPGPAKSIAPGEPTENAVAKFGIPPAPEASARMTAAADSPLVPAPGVTVPQKPAVDPFANLFPSDTKTAANDGGEAKTDSPMAEAKMNQPYTGLTLDADPLEKPKSTGNVLVPAPAEMASSAAPSVAAEMPQIKEDSSPRPKLQAAPADLPKVDLSLPGDLPQLKGTGSVAEVPPATPPAMPAEVPPALAVTPPASPTPVPASVPASVPAPVQAPPAMLPVAPVQTASIGNSDITITPAPVKEKPAVSNEQKSKLERIAARQGQTGLKGFCPVMLRDHRELVDSQDEYSLIYNGRPYALSSQDAMEKFLAEPLKYAPASGCCDVIHLALTGEKLEGSLDYAVWYKGRLYLFSGVETMETFVAAPSSHASND